MKTITVKFTTNDDNTTDIKAQCGRFSLTQKDAGRTANYEDACVIARDLAEKCGLRQCNWHLVEMLSHGFVFVASIDKAF